MTAPVPAPVPAGAQAPFVALEGLRVVYRARRRAPVHAVRDVSLAIRRGATLALIGESGSGKSTIARAVCGLEPAEAGRIVLDGTDLLAQRDPADAAGRLGVQIVFQDPLLALDPRWPVWRSIAEPRLRRQPAAERDHRAAAVALLERVALHPSLADRRPRELSGGQRQRVVIARALAGAPRLMVLDEAVSALDVSVRNEVLGLLDELKRSQALTYLLISHDMGAVAQLATDVAVLYLGRLMECGPVERVVREPLHPYTRALIRAVPTVRGDPLAQIESLDERPGAAGSGCPFEPRCPLAVARCATEPPVPQPIAGREVSCHRAAEIAHRSAAGVRFPVSVIHAREV